MAFMALLPDGFCGEFKASFHNPLNGNGMQISIYMPWHAWMYELQRASILKIFIHFF